MKTNETSRFLSPFKSKKKKFQNHMWPQQHMNKQQFTYTDTCSLLATKLGFYSLKRTIDAIGSSMHLFEHMGR